MVKSASGGRGPSQRQLRVGELLREALSEVLARGHFRDPMLDDGHITVTEVRAAPDLRSARVFVMPLGGEAAEEKLEALRRAGPYLRGEVNRRVRLKYSPVLHFELDQTFDEVGRIDRLLAPDTSDEAAPDGS